MSSFHKTNLGSYGEIMKSDLDGFVHTTIGDWMAARVDLPTMTHQQKLKWAKSLAAESRDGVAAAHAGMARTRAGL